jgi:transposase
MKAPSLEKLLTAEERAALQAILRKRKTAALIARRANALLLLDDGLTPDQIARVLYLDDETVCEWRRIFVSDGLSSIGLKGYARRDGQLNRDQESELCDRLRTHPPRSTGEVRTLITTLFGVNYSISGSIALMHRLGFSYKKPKPLPAGADEAAQAAHIAAYEQLLNGLDADETVVFADAVHPEHQSRPAYGWFSNEEKVAVKTTTGRQRINIHGAFNLETFDFTFVEDLKISGETTLRLLEKLERAYPHKRRIHVFVDNARYHHAKMLQPWLERPRCRIKLHFLPPYAPHLNPIERLWGVMHEHITHNKYYPNFTAFLDAVLRFFTKTVPAKASEWRDTITDNFRIITQKQYRLIG